MATHSSILAWRIRGERSLSGSQRVGYDWSDLAYMQRGRNWKRQGEPEASTGLKLVKRDKGGLERRGLGNGSGLRKSLAMLMVPVGAKVPTLVSLAFLDFGGKQWGNVASGFMHGHWKLCPIMAPEKCLKEMHTDGIVYWYHNHLQVIQVASLAGTYTIRQGRSGDFIMRGLKCQFRMCTLSNKTHCKVLKNHLERINIWNYIWINAHMKIFKGGKVARLTYDLLY